MRDDGILMAINADLLAALEAIAKLADENPEDHGDNVAEFEEHLDRIADGARAAIAKAKGAST